MKIWKISYFIFSVSYSLLYNKMSSFEALVLWFSSGLNRRLASDSFKMFIFGVTVVF